MDDYINKDLRKTLQTISESYKVIVNQLPQTKIYTLPPTVQKSMQALTATMSEYQNTLNSVARHSAPIRSLTVQLDSVWGEQLQQLQKSANALQATLQNPAFSQITETVDIISAHFKNYNDAINFTVPYYIENELQQAYEEVESIDIELEDETLDLDESFKNQDLSNVSFMDKLMFLLNIITLIVSVHGNYLQLEANEIEKEKVEQLESIDNHLEIITKYIHDHIDNYDELNNEN